MERHVWIAQTNNKYGKLELGNRPLLPVQITFNMTQEQIIDRLKWLIQDWEEEVQCLEEMVDNWENHDDPGSDPGLQFEQDLKIDRTWNNIVNFCKDNLK